MLFAEQGFQDLVNRWKSMDGVEPVSFDEFFNLTSGSMATRMSQGLPVLQKYHYVMSVFSYDANYKRPL